MSIKSLAVFCGSQSGRNPLFEAHAKKLGCILAEKNIHLIYGGGNKGIMGAIANAGLEKGCRITGIMPHFLSSLEHCHKGLTELIEVTDMHTRKKLLYEKCDAALILPGGFGTMDEFFEMLTWNQLNLHDKKIFVLNTAGFYDHLLLFLNTMEKEGFLYDKISDRIIVINEPGDISF